MTKQMAVHYIREYIDENLSPNMHIWRKDVHQWRTQMRFVLMRLARMIDESNENPMYVCDQYLAFLNDMLAHHPNPKKRVIFEASAVAVEEIDEYLSAIEGVY